ncbi:MAG: hypothetical protein JJT87_12560 [Halomonas sp.]|nr:hypothetical protein [Halomonas sp.]MCC5902742.1 hypothetical protein [Halomonas sp.]
MKNKLKNSVVLKAMLSVIDRSSATVSAACLVAAMLGTAVDPYRVTIAYIGAVVFFQLAVLAAIWKAQLNEQEDA